MNIFVTYPCPNQSAKTLDDIRVISQTKESAQMLSTAIWYHRYQSNWSWGRLRDKEEKEKYKAATGLMLPTHVNHPCNKWTRETVSNYFWLWAHFVALTNEFYARRNKFHACERLNSLFREGIAFIPNGKLTSFVNCTENHQDKDVHLAYKLHLNDKWKNDEKKPTWFGEERG